MIGFGTKCNTEKDIIQEAINVGYTFIDLKDSNKSILHFNNLQFYREKLFICSKLVGESSPENHNPKNIYNNCLQTLKKAGLTYWDLYYIHTTFAYNNYPILKTYNEVLRLKKEGYVLNVGLSNITFEQLEAIIINSTKPDYIQIEIHPYLVENRIVEFCKNNQIKIVSHSPLGSSLWTTISNDPILLALSKKYNTIVAKLILNWHISRGIIPIPSSNNKDNIRNNLNNLTRIDISTEDLQSITNLNKNQRTFIKPNHYESIGPICEPLPKRKIILEDCIQNNIILNDIIKKGFYITTTEIDKELHMLCTQSSPNVNLIKNNSFIKSISSMYDNKFLTKCEIRTNLPNNNLSPIHTQLYHRDTQLQKCLKIIIYLSDVKKENGPLQIIYPEPDMNLKWYNDRINARTTPEEIYQNVPLNNIITVEGPIYTMIIFEGTILHCGGYVQKGVRKIIYLE
jgi:diketogulonate reductase-like aldo/keto reductase